MYKRFALMMLLVFTVMLFAPVLFAEEGAAAQGEAVSLKEANPDVAKWAIITAGIAMMFASSIGTIAQSNAVKTACLGIARNFSFPSN